MNHSGFDVLQYEFLAERAGALGRQGVKVEKALACLKDSVGSGCGDAERQALRADAAEAVWALFVQREICGLRDQRDAIRRYGIPAEVMALVGVVRRS
ncbi:hypothetical protein LXM94_03230 [Rhizobium sp. TRM95111]|uniref:DUF6665 family protein n=1 Tax=Rhizobium alarense TaxID=2846851 RepID=UPI001F273EA4|nr:DUF6665 family protein [Rhizobium alarense]MCF3638977.1 hypothetical protein [Rhizobium alarense]